MAWILINREGEKFLFFLRRLPRVMVEAKGGDSALKINYVYLSSIVSQRATLPAKAGTMRGGTTYS